MICNFLREAIYGFRVENAGGEVIYALKGESNFNALVEFYNLSSDELRSFREFARTDAIVRGRMFNAHSWDMYTVKKHYNSWKSAYLRRIR